MLGRPFSQGTQLPSIRFFFLCFNSKWIPTQLPIFIWYLLGNPSSGKYDVCSNHFYDILVQGSSNPTLCSCRHVSTFRMKWTVLVNQKVWLSDAVCDLFDVWSQCDLNLSVLRVAPWDGRSHRRATSVMSVRSVFTWWRESVPRACTSTGSVSAVPPAAPLSDREHMLLTLKIVSIY